MSNEMATPSLLSLLVMDSEPDTTTDYKSTTYQGPPIGFSAKVTQHENGETTVVGNMLAPRPKLFIECEDIKCEKCFSEQQSEISSPTYMSAFSSPSLYGSFPLATKSRPADRSVWVAAREAWNAAVEVRDEHRVDEMLTDDDAERKDGERMIVCPRRSPPVVDVVKLEEGCVVL